VRPPCHDHEHPYLRRPLSRAQIRAELERLYRQAGYTGPLDLRWTDELRRTHNRNTRRYAQVRPFLEVPQFELAPQTAYLPRPNRRALLAHEIGHVLDPHGDEDEADEAARRALGIRISYDKRWPGKGLQVTRDNPRRRKGYLLDELLATQPPAWTSVMTHAQRVLADEPMRWYFEESDQEYWNEREEFRNIAPVYDLLWIEHQAPRFIRSEEKGIVEWPAGNWGRAGTLLVTAPRELLLEVDPELAEPFPTSRWITKATIFTGADEHGPAGPRWTFVYGVEPDGSFSDAVGRGSFLAFPEGIMKDAVALAPPSLREAAALEGGNFYKGPWRVALLTLYFMHARGTQLRPVRVPRKVAEARRKKGRPTGEGYRILDVGLGARQTLAEAKREGGGAKSALRKHLRRGHFAVYGEGKPHVSGFVGSMWRSPTVVGRGEAMEKDYRVRGDKRKRKRKRKKNPSERERVREVYRRYQAYGDPDDFELYLNLRERIGLPRESRGHARAQATQAAKPTHRRKRMKVVEAEKVIEAWLRAAGWRVDDRARGYNPVWIRGDGRQRLTFKRTHVIFERGGRGNWVRDYKVHRWGDPLGTIDFAERLLRNTQAKLEDPYALNPDDEPMLPARIPVAKGRPPRRTSFALMAQGQAPLIYLPAGVTKATRERTLAKVGAALERMLMLPPDEGGLTTPDSWEDLLSLTSAGSATLFAVDRNGERWKVMRVHADPGGWTGEIELLHQGRMGRYGPRWVDLEAAYGRLLPMVVYKGR
jgi:hypothetical protein